MEQIIKATSGVFLLKTENAYNHGDITTVTTKYGKELELVIWKLYQSNKGFNYYSYTRADGYCAKQKFLNKAEKRKEWAESAEKKSEAYYEKSNKDRDFLVLGEPIKRGHHSEKRHVKAIEDANINMGKCVEFDNKAKDHLSKIQGLEAAAENIFLDQPDSLQQLRSLLQALDERKKEHGGNPNLYAKIRRYKQRLTWAVALWELPNDQKSEA